MHVVIHHGTCRSESEMWVVRGYFFWKSQKDEEYIYETFTSQNHRMEEFGGTSVNCLVQPSCTYQGRREHLAHDLEMTVRYIIVLDILVLAIVYVKFLLFLFWSVSVCQNISETFRSHE